LRPHDAQDEQALHSLYERLRSGERPRKIYSISCRWASSTVQRRDHVWWVGGEGSIDV